MNPRRIAAVLLLGTACGGAGCAQMTAEAYDRSMLHKSAPDFELADLDGRTVRLSDFRGKPVVLAFWAYG